MKIRTPFFIAGVLLICAGPVQAQWVKVPPAKVPRTPEGKPDLSAPAPRLPNGKPDLSGIWYPDSKFIANVAIDLKPGELPLQPWAKALFEERKTGSLSREEPTANCLPQGVPRIDAAPWPWKVVQMSDYIAIVYEAFSLWRQIYLDGRELAEDAPPTWLGYSTGKWDGDTLVVDTRGFNGKMWMDQLGTPSTEALHLIERFRRRDFGHMDIEITIDDPKAYTKPWTVKEQAGLMLDTELMEAVCNENERDRQHIPASSPRNDN